MKLYIHYFVHSPGDHISVSGPEGTFTPRPLRDVTHLYLLAAGTGFTPMARLIGLTLQDIDTVRLDFREKKCIGLIHITFYVKFTPCLFPEASGCCFLTGGRRISCGAVSWTNWLLTMRGTAAATLYRKHVFTMWRHVTLTYTVLLFVLSALPYCACWKVINSHSRFSTCLLTRQGHSEPETSFLLVVHLYSIMDWLDLGGQRSRSQSPQKTLSTHNCHNKQL